MLLSCISSCVVLYRLNSTVPSPSPPFSRLTTHICIVLNYPVTWGNLDWRSCTLLKMSLAFPAISRRTAGQPDCPRAGFGRVLTTVDRESCATGTTREKSKMCSHTPVNGQSAMQRHSISTITDWNCFSAMHRKY